jgi:ABC-type cobalamin/Fe3+-siderophores transport system ATPase subunit
MGILLSTHNPDHALMCADRVVLLHGGHIVETGPPAQTITPNNLRTVYGVDVDIIAVGDGETKRTLCIPRVQPSSHARRPP